MNIFRIDNDPEIATSMMIDRHVNKMIIESCQMLCNAFSTEQLESAPLTASGLVRKHSNLHHPCSKWVLSHLDNYMWLVKHTDALIKERKYRFGKGHFCESIFSWVCDRIPSLPLGGSEPPRAFNEDLYKHDNVVEAYRLYYKAEKKFDKKGRPMMKYTKRPIPTWMED